MSEPVQLSRFGLFAGANPALLAAAAARVQQISVPAGAVVLDFGDASTDLFLIVEGAVRVVSRTRGGDELVLGDLAGGEFFGEMAAVDGEPRSANVTALHRSRLWRLPADAFLAVVLGSPPVGHRLLHLLSDRIRAKDERILELVTLPVRLRLCADLLRLGRPRHDGTYVLSPPLQQHVLAARIGARREAVSRELAALVRCGLIDNGRRAIILRDPAKLRALVDAGQAGAPGRNTVTRQR